MARSIWKGSISFGLVNIPVAVFPATKRESLDFTMLDKRNMSPVGYKRYNKQTGKEVEWDDIVKGYEYEKDQYVVLGDEELRQANVKATQSIDIIEFVKADQIPFTYFDQPYFLEPMKKIGEKGYALLRETLARTNRVGIAQVILRSRQHLAVVAPMGDLLVLDLLRYPYELLAPNEISVPKEARVSKKEIEMAERLVADMTAKWNPAHYKDDYRDDVMKLVEKKVAAGKTLEIDTESKETSRPNSNVIDFMTLLKRSIEEKEKGKKPKGTSARPATRAKPRATRRRPAAVPRHGRKRA